MAMQPIDLQILFSQLDSVAKDAAAQRDGLTLRAAITASTLEKKSEEKSRSVNEMRDSGEELETLNSEKKQNPEKSSGRKFAPKSGGQEARPFFRDPSLGNYIDLKG
ncbi:MAG: hypothetical protein LBJ86_07760 [Spirochaetaceae bacterium]|jgi:hypothetical protein|nr:hypothetical protein [Spirochaetaceae bacterium]